ncbi:hypothetical protein SAMN04487962_11116 [Marinobacter segnicrescens]|uniref:Uncharacterized protein n=1 Tax=Marinobacter segnicrescens TaxID=430453 RepID=A0A1I0EW78_9GAMM|nr:hypothetical protein [Marinobacter segnicrescens]SET49886.1 hypothetical protein SAMN04487962_11116 [Marinobacter segnicrescens]
MLTVNEKDYLLDMVFAVIGEDQAVRNYKSGFNEEAIAVVEQMIEANTSCNENMRKLAKDLLGGSGTLARGWLEKVLKSAKRKVSASWPVEWLTNSKQAK